MTWAMCCKDVPQGNTLGIGGPRAQHRVSLLSGSVWHPGSAAGQGCAIRGCYWVRGQASCREGVPARGLKVSLCTGWVHGFGGCVAWAGGLEDEVAEVRLPRRMCQ